MKCAHSAVTPFNASGRQVKYLSLWLFPDFSPSRHSLAPNRGDTVAGTASPEVEGGNRVVALAAQLPQRATQFMRDRQKSAGDKPKPSSRTSFVDIGLPPKSSLPKRTGTIGTPEPSGCC